MITEQHFSKDYTTARQRFREAVATSEARLDSLTLAVKGPNGEDLTIDIGWFGSPKPRRVFVHSSGLHGVEAFAGSAIQLQWLKEGMPSVPDDAAIVLVHALNPYGMAWFRRFNENNVDLNRKVPTMPCVFWKHYEPRIGGISMATAKLIIRQSRGCSRCSTPRTPCGASRFSNAAER
jgi:hypothetical protein